MNQNFKSKCPFSFASGNGPMDCLGNECAAMCQDECQLIFNNDSIVSILYDIHETLRDINDAINNIDIN